MFRKSTNQIYSVKLALIGRTVGIEGRISHILHYHNHLAELNHGVKLHISFGIKVLRHEIAGSEGASAKTA